MQMIGFFLYSSSIQITVYFNSYISHVKWKQNSLGVKIDTFEHNYYELIFALSIKFDGCFWRFNDIILISINLQYSKKEEDENHTFTQGIFLYTYV